VRFRSIPRIYLTGGLLVTNAQGDIVGAVGVSGDTSDNDEAAALAGITAAGLTRVVGALPAQ
jgi:uncharacterized protein GlcG (DUF336 family)